MSRSTCKERAQQSRRRTRNVTAVPISLVFIIVRHPWTRLLSCYRDKFEQTNDPHFFSNVGSKILIHTRGYPMGISKEKGQYLAKQLMDHLAFGIPLSPDNPYLLPTPKPTFREFLEYVASYPTGDEHWTPAHILCTPCNKFLNYSVAKFEKFDTEIRALLEEIGVHENLLRHNAPTNEKKIVETSGLVEDYFRGLDSALLGRVFRHYRNDFVLFGYDQDEFFPFTTRL